jgi:hypothetical protein
MAKFELKFLDECYESTRSFIMVERTDFQGDGDLISISGINEGAEFLIQLDKSTAIKFAKTLRTEINKITESEAKNG